MAYTASEPRPHKKPGESTWQKLARLVSVVCLHLLAWSHYAFGRAVVPTLALMVLGALFVFVPQTAEVLRNLRESGSATAPLGPQTMLWFDLAHWAFADTDFLFLITAALTAALLGAGAWLSMFRWSSEDFPAYLRPYAELQAWAGRHLAFVVAGALVLIVGAYLQSVIPEAPGGSRARHLVGWAWAATPVMGMFAVRLAHSVCGRSDRGWAALVGLLLLTGYSVGAVLAFGTGWRSSLCNVAAATLPALGYGLVTFMLNFAESQDVELKSDEARTLFVFVLAILVLLPVVMSLIITLTPVIVVQSYGGASLVLMQLWGLFAVALLLSTGLRGILHEVPGATLFVALLALGALWWAVPERYGKEHGPTPATPAAGVAIGRAGSPAAADPKFKNAAWAGAPTGLYVAIHADGGGIRAAYFTAMVLARADDMTCGEFGARLFAASGVSGGSLGLATWAALRQELVLRQSPDPKHRWMDCDPAAARAGRAQLVLQKLVGRTLVRDHLSPVLARMLGSDALPIPWWPARRGQALVDSWQSAALEAMQEMGFTASSAEVYARPLAATSAGLYRVPWLLLNATDALTGQRVVQLNAQPAPSFAQGGRPAATTPLGVATLDSARFPYLSPAGEVPATDGLSRRRLLVDGGYFDNSGAASLRELLIDADIVKPKGTVTILRLEGNPSDDERAVCEQVLGTKPDASRDRPLWAGLSAYFSTRTAHANEAVSSLRALALKLSDTGTKYVPGERLTLRYALERQGTSASATAVVEQADLAVSMEACQTSLAAVKAPLGWYLSGPTAKFMQPSIEASAEELIRATGLK